MASPPGVLPDMRLARNGQADILGKRKGNDMQTTVVITKCDNSHCNKQVEQQIEPVVYGGVVKKESWLKLTYESYEHWYCSSACLLRGYFGIKPKPQDGEKTT